MGKLVIGGKNKKPLMDFKMAKVATKFGKVKCKKNSLTI